MTSDAYRHVRRLVIAHNKDTTNECLIYVQVVTLIFEGSLLGWRDSATPRSASQIRTSASFISVLRSLYWVLGTGYWVLGSGSSLRILILSLRLAPKIVKSTTPPHPRARPSEE